MTKYAIVPVEPPTEAMLLALYGDGITAPERFQRLVASIPPSDLVAVPRELLERVCESIAGRNPHHKSVSGVLLRELRALLSPPAAECPECHKYVGRCPACHRPRPAPTATGEVRD